MCQWRRAQVVTEWILSSRTLLGRHSMAENDETAVAPPKVRTRKRPKHEPPRPQPRYHVILWDDPDHSFDFVIQMMRELFGHPPEAGHQIARSVDKEGRAICLTTTLEHAELKRD